MMMIYTPVLNSQMMMKIMMMMKKMMIDDIDDGCHTGP